jgi:hypothetical protein
LSDHNAIRGALVDFFVAADTITKCAYHLKREVPLGCDRPIPVTGYYAALDTIVLHFSLKIGLYYILRRINKS